MELRFDLFDEVYQIRTGTGSGSLLRNSARDARSWPV